MKLKKKKRKQTCKRIVKVPAKEIEADADAGGGETESEYSGQLEPSLDLIIREPIGGSHLPESIKQHV